MLATAGRLRFLGADTPAELERHLTCMVATAFRDAPVNLSAHLANLATGVRRESDANPTRIPLVDAAGLTLDHRLLAALAREVDVAYDLLASQIAEMFRAYEAKGVSRDRQMVIALATLVKLTVENFVLHQRLMREAGNAPTLPRGAERIWYYQIARANAPPACPCITGCRGIFPYLPSHYRATMTRRGFLAMWRECDTAGLGPAVV